MKVKCWFAQFNYLMIWIKAEIGICHLELPLISTDEFHKGKVEKNVRKI